MNTHELSTTRIRGLNNKSYECEAKAVRAVFANLRRRALSVGDRIAWERLEVNEGHALSILNRFYKNKHAPWSIEQIEELE